MSYRKEIEQLALWYIPAFILTLVISGIVTEYFKDLARGDLSSLEQTLATAWFIYLFKFVDNLVVAIWLFFQARKNGFRIYLWCAFGLIANLLAVVIYLLVKIIDDNSLNKQLLQGDELLSKNSA